MYNTLITSVDESELFGNETVEESPELTYEHITSGSGEDYPYHQQEHFEETEVKDTVSETSYLSPKMNARQTALNLSGIQRSGMSLPQIISALQQSVDMALIRQRLTEHNQNNNNDQYAIDSSLSRADAVLTEAIHQFQMAHYIAPGEHDGIIGQSTMETLGLFGHRLRPRLSSSGFYGQGILNNIKSLVTAETNNEFTAENWYENMVKPAWLGIKIHDGVHLLFLRKLKEAEKWLLDQPQYQGLTPAQLGKALGFDARSRYSAARLSSANQAMHGFGLAIDINVPGNPWVGAGWIRYDKELLRERSLMIDALKKASGDPSLPGSTIFSYLHNIAETTGDDTISSYNILKQRNDEFIQYLKNNAGELAYWKKSQTFGGRDPLKGFLNLHPDLVYALRHIAGLAWGAMDFGPGASGDIMHFDFRTLGFGRTLCKKIGGFVPADGLHPARDKEVFESEDYPGQLELHEAIGEAEWRED